MTESAELVERLADAERDRERHHEAITDVGEERVETAVDARRRLLDLLDRYEGRATGTGDFEAFVRFQEELTTFVSELPEEMVHRDAFERVEDDLDKRRVSEADFDHARETLAPVSELAETVDARASALERYREARAAVSRRTAEVESRLDDLEHMRDLGDAYLDVADAEDPAGLIDGIRDPIAAYNEAVDAAFAEMKSAEPSREVLAFVVDADGAFVDYRTPPADLRDYLSANGAGEHSIPKLVEYADYSPKKLDHYVTDPMELKRHVATHRTYLERLDAEPLRLSWPPRPPAELRHRAEKLISTVDSFAPTEAIVRLRTVCDLTRDEEWFARLADAAHARERLGEDELARLESGELADEREAVRAERETLSDALAAYPER